MAPGDQRRTRGRAGGGGLRVAVVDVHGGRVAAAGLTRWLARVAPAAARGTVTIALAPDGFVRTLNRKYRKRDYPTDVLSFPGTGRQGSDKLRRPSIASEHLGDIVIATGVARRQAREAGHDSDTEVRILALHGLLHLLGYDHERDGGRMSRLERHLRRKGGLREGLVERASGRVRA